MVIREQEDQIYRNLILAHLNLIPLFSFDLFLLALSRDVMQSALVPVPLGNLGRSHTNLYSDLHFLLIAPVGILFEVLLQDLFLVVAFAHAPVRAIIDHIVLFKGKTDLRKLLGRIFLAKFSRHVALMRCNAIILV